VYLRTAVMGQISAARPPAVFHDLRGIARVRHGGDSICICSGTTGFVDPCSPITRVLTSTT